MADIDNLIKQLGQLTVVEAGELAKKLEEAWGVKAEAMQVAAPTGAPAQEDSAELNVVLTGFADNSKIPVLKKVREFTDLGLLEAKKFVEDLPKEVKKGVDKEEANKIKAALEEVGGTVEIK